MAMYHALSTEALERLVIRYKDKSTPHALKILNAVYHELHKRKLKREEK